MTYQGKTSENELKTAKTDGEKTEKTADESEEQPENKDDLLQAYFKESKRYPLLSREEEKDAFKRYINSGDKEARKLIIVSNLRLVIKIALQYYGYAYFSPIDLVQEGNLGLIRAVEKYDLNRNVKFSYYASFWIKAYILNYIMKNKSIVKFITTEKRKKLFNRLKKEKRKLVKEGIDPDVEVIAEKLDIEVEEVLEMEKFFSKGDVSLDSPLLEDGDTHGVDLMPSDIDTEEIVSDYDLKEKGRELLERFRETLSERELIVFDNRLYCKEALALKEIGGGKSACPGKESDKYKKR